MGGIVTSVSNVGRDLVLHRSVRSIDQEKRSHRADFHRTDAECC